MILTCHFNSKNCSVGVNITNMLYLCNIISTWHGFSTVWFNTYTLQVHLTKGCVHATAI